MENYSNITEKNRGEKPAINHEENESEDLYQDMCVTFPESEASFSFPIHINYESTRLIENCILRTNLSSFIFQNEKEQPNEPRSKRRSFSLKRVPVQNEDLMCAEDENWWCSPSLVKQLWKQKNRMDAIFDTGMGKIYKNVRDRLCPLDKKGSSVYWNRAGDKLNEVWNATEWWEKDDDFINKLPITFLDICGGPGSWSQYLLQKSVLPPHSTGFGVTLNTPQSDSWYKELLDNDRFQPLYGIDETGNIYSPANLSNIINYLSDKPVKLVLADGGFKITRDDKGKHMENLQELYSGRIIFSEALLGLSVLQEGGIFICKFFDTFSTFSASLIMILCTLFETICIVKPPHSRTVNSERYVVASGFLGRNEICTTLLKFMRELHSHLDDEYLPLSVIPDLGILHNDLLFVKSMREMNTKICERQIDALRGVMNETEQECYNRKRTNSQNSSESYSKRQNSRTYFQSVQGVEGYKNYSTVQREEISIR